MDHHHGNNKYYPKSSNYDLDNKLVTANCIATTGDCTYNEKKYKLYDMKALAEERLVNVTEEHEF